MKRGFTLATAAALVCLSAGAADAAAVVSIEYVGDSGSHLVGTLSDSSSHILDTNGLGFTFYSADQYVEIDSFGQAIKINDGIAADFAGYIFTFSGLSGVINGTHLINATGSALPANNILPLYTADTINLNLNRTTFYAATDLQAVYSLGAAAPAPEPASWALMVGGFGMVGATMRRKKAAVRFA